MTLNACDVLGRRVRALVDGAHAPGPYDVVWDGRDESGPAVASGLYFYRIEWSGKCASGRVLLLK